MERNRRKAGIVLAVITLLILLGGWYLYEENRNPWVFVGENFDNKFFVNEKSIKVDKGVIEFTILMEQQNQQSDVSHAISLVRMNRDGKRFFAGQGEVHYKSGRIETPAMNQWFSVSPGSPMEKAYKYAQTKVNN